MMSAVKKCKYVFNCVLTILLVAVWFQILPFYNMACDIPNDNDTQNVKYYNYYIDHVCNVICFLTCTGFQ